MDKASVLAAAFPDADPDSATAYYSSEGDLYQALMFSDLFWPSCFIARGAVFVAVGPTSPQWVEEGLQMRAAQEQSARRAWSAFVAGFNWFEVQHLFGHIRGPQEQLDDALDLLAAVLQQAWSARLAQLFPDRSFEVSINDDGPEALNVSVKQVSPELVEPEHR